MGSCQPHEMLGSEQYRKSSTSRSLAKNWNSPFPTMPCGTLVGDSLNTVLARVLERKRTNQLTIYDKGVCTDFIRCWLDRSTVTIVTQKKLRTWYLLRA